MQRTRSFQFVLRLFSLTMFCAATAITSPAQTFTTLVTFDGGPVFLALIQGTDGNFYGTTSNGGTGYSGTVFNLTPSGTLTNLYTFCSQYPNCTDGASPEAGLVQAADGNFYGTTTFGGASNNCTGGCGTAFKMTAQGALTTLHSFDSTDGHGSGGPLVQGTDGNFYGTTPFGGVNGGYGTVFKITPEGTLTTLYSFDFNDGSNPWAALVQATDGNFYGTTSFGGANGNGMVFQITPGGTLTTLYSFCSQHPSCTDGATPFVSALVQGTDGNFYGTTQYGGSNACTNGCGTVFKMTPQGALTTLHRFDGSDGSAPVGGLVQATDGNFYGTTSSGGTSLNCSGGCGTVFKITSDGTLTTLHNFDVFSDGQTPYGKLLQATNGSFYGTTAFGGIGWGTAYSLSVGLGPFVVTQPTSGSVGTPVTILGTNLTGATGVTFNGTPAMFNASASEITTTVPAGATTGPVQVMTPGGTLTSNVNFLVILPHTLTVSTSGNGTVASTDGFITCPGTCSHLYPGNTQVTLNAVPAAGWTFSGWSGTCSGTGPCNVTMTQDLSVGAVFTQLSYTLTVSTVGSGTVTSTDGFINCPGTCSHSYLSNTQLTLNASPGQGWRFGGWSGPCNGTGSCNMTMTQTLSLGATFFQNGILLQFIPVTPCRLVDTRKSGGPIQGGTSRDFIVPQEGGCNIPATAAAYSLNVTVVPPGPLGYLTIWPTGEVQPLASTLNSLDGRIKANAAIVPAGDQGAVSVFVSNTTDVVLDIDGYFALASDSTLAFYPLTPCRIADTRKAKGDLGGPSLTGKQERDFAVLESSCIPANANAMAYSFNFTAVPLQLGQALGYLTVWPTGQSKPLVSTLNNLTGTIVANAAIVPAGTNGEISVYPDANTNLVIDIDGYFAAPGQGGLSLYPAVPCRVIDTRKIGNGQPFSGTLSPPVDVVDSACGPPSTAQAYVFNATAVPFGGLGYLTLWPDGESQPLVSTLNAIDGAITSNMAIVPTTNGSVDAYASGITQLILDISSYFAP